MHDLLISQKYTQARLLDPMNYHISNELYQVENKLLSAIKEEQSDDNPHGASLAKAKQPPLARSKQRADAKEGELSVSQTSLGTVPSK